MIKRETLVVGVTAFLRLDAVDVLSREDDRDPALDPLETAVEEEAFDFDFLSVLLSIDAVGTLDEDELALLPIVLGVLTIGEEGSEALPAGEGSELLRGSGRDRLNGSFVAELTLLVCFLTEICFSCELPVLFLLNVGASIEVVRPLSMVGFLGFGLTTLETFLDSILFRVGPVLDPDDFKDDETVGLITLLGIALTFSEVGTLPEDPSFSSISLTNQQT